ncbi:TadE family type IV pilus minor pilin [Microbacterium sp. YY-03]|uniref:TadE family type IV pilus minor pilin n=1 Tax=Microbacterium sp. YY-03 TaxID=3421636 RepID=UPI003D1844C5
MRWWPRVRALAVTERGSATAEFAIALPAIMVAILVMSALISAQGKQILLQDAAADAARLIARDDDIARAESTIATAVPGAAMNIAFDGSAVCVTASAAATVVVPLTLSARACALAGGH